MIATAVALAVTAEETSARHSRTSWPATDAAKETVALDAASRTRCADDVTLADDAADVAAPRMRLADADVEAVDAALDAASRTRCADDVMLVAIETLADAGLMLIALALVDEAAEIATAASTKLPSTP